MAATPWTLRIDGLADTRRAFKALGETDTPFYLSALHQSADLVTPAIDARAPGSMAGKAELVKIRGTGISASAVVRVNHPGSLSYEFGRQFWYRGFTARRQKRTGTRFKASPGQAAKPFVGLKHGDQAIGAVAPRVHSLMANAVEREFVRVANGGR